MPTFIWYILGGIIVLSVIAYFLQEKLIFKPEKLKQDFEFKYDAPFREYFFDCKFDRCSDNNFLLLPEWSTYLPKN